MSSFQAKIYLYSNKKLEKKCFKKFPSPAHPIAVVVVFILWRWKWTEPDNISSLQRGFPAGMTLTFNLSWLQTKDPEGRASPSHYIACKASGSIDYILIVLYSTYSAL